MESDKELIQQISYDNTFMIELLSAKEKEYQRLSAECNYYKGLCLTSEKVFLFLISMLNFYRNFMHVLLL